jgi:hypothetical protein
VGRGRRVFPVQARSLPITSLRDLAIGIVCPRIGAGTARFSSAVARAIASLQPKPSKEVNE